MCSDGAFIMQPMKTNNWKKNSIPMSFINASGKKATSDKRHIRLKISKKLKIAINLIVTRDANVVEVEGKQKIVMSERESGITPDKWIVPGWSYIFFPNLQIYQMSYHEMIPMLRKGLQSTWDISQKMEASWLAAERPSRVNRGPATTTTASPPAEVTPVSTKLSSVYPRLSAQSRTPMGWKSHPNNNKSQKVRSFSTIPSRRRTSQPFGLRRNEHYEQEKEPTALRHSSLEQPTRVSTYPRRDPLQGVMLSRNTDKNERYDDGDEPKSLQARGVSPSNPSSTRYQFTSRRANQQRYGLQNGSHNPEQFEGDETYLPRQTLQSPRKENDRSFTLAGVEFKAPAHSVPRPNLLTEWDDAEDEDFFKTLVTKADSRRAEAFRAERANLTQWFGRSQMILRQKLRKAHRNRIHANSKTDPESTQKLNLLEPDYPDDAISGPAERKISADLLALVNASATNYPQPLPKASQATTESRVEETIQAYDPFSRTSASNNIAPTPHPSPSELQAYDPFAPISAPSPNPSPILPDLGKPDIDALQAFDPFAPKEATSSKQPLHSQESPTPPTPRPLVTRQHNSGARVIRGRLFTSKPLCLSWRRWRARRARALSPPSSIDPDDPSSV